MTTLLSDAPAWQRIGAVMLVAVLVHLLVRLIRLASGRAMTSSFATSISKTRTLICLASSALVFALYFTAIGFALSELGVSLKAYFASASIIGLAVAFGSQGLVQDVVSGLTIVFTNLFDIDDVVEINGEVGVVEKFGVRFTELRNAMGALVFVPNRSVTNVVIYPRGYVRCLVDIVLPGDGDRAAKVAETVRLLAEAATEQYPGIFRALPEIGAPVTGKTGSGYMRLKFRIWPGRGGPLEGPFRDNLLQAIRQIDPDFADWMVSVNYEVEAYQPPTRRFTIRHSSR